LPVVVVFDGAEGIEVTLVELSVEEELERKVVVNDPAKYMLEPFALEEMESTGPLRPPNSTEDQDDDVVDQSATLPPDPVGALKDPPTQTCEWALSQYRELTVPERPGETA
jgi:hypothetical protein